MRWDFVLMMLPGLIAGLTLHEFAHALAASILGDNFARRQGRVSLNPFRHLTPLGTFALVFLPIGWGKPVPVNLYNFKHPRFYYFLTGLAGPLANAFLVCFFMAMMEWTRHPYRFDGWMREAMIELHSYLIAGTVINIALATLNLLPIPPLDGSKIWPCILPFVKPTFHPKTSLFFLIVVVVLLSSGQLQPLLKNSVEMVMETAPQSDVYLRMKAAIEAGNRCMIDRRWADAERYFSEAASCNLLSDPCYFGRAAAFYEQGKHKEALRDVDRALELYSDPHYYDLKADILVAMDRIQEAREARRWGSDSLNIP
jgi:Zn-dependent protease